MWIEHGSGVDPDRGSEVGWTQKERPRAATRGQKGVQRSWVKTNARGSPIGWLSAGAAVVEFSCQQEVGLQPCRS